MYSAFGAFMLCSLYLVMGGFAEATAQSIATASQSITPSVFAGVTGVETGLNSGRNVSITAGVDVAFRPRGTFHPALEYRAMYPFDKGGVDSLKSNLGGLKVFVGYGRFRPYADILAGRGETTYANGGYQVPGKPIFYTKSSSNVFSLGGGADVLTTGHFSIKADVQFQRYSSPVIMSGHLYSETATLGIVYTVHRGR